MGIHFPGAIAETSWAQTVVSSISLSIQHNDLSNGLSRWLSSKESACNAEAAGDTVSIPRFRGFPGGGNGNPLQYSCLDNPMDRGAWWAIVHGVVKSTSQICLHWGTPWSDLRTSSLSLGEDSPLTLGHQDTNWKPQRSDWARGDIPLRPENFHFWFPCRCLIPRQSLWYSRANPVLTCCLMSYIANAPATERLDSWPHGMWQLCHVAFSPEMVVAFL